jgi:glycosyltransferase involved in cell wall biosynthesis
VTSTLQARPRDRTHAGQHQAQSGLAPLSVIILTHNEAASIERCLASLEWADDVVVVDSGSTDATTGIAAELRNDARIFSHRFRDFGDQRNWALDHTDPRHDWILFLDADEICPPALAGQIRCVVARPGGPDGYFLACRNYFLGRWIRRCTFYPSWQLRLFRRGSVRFRKEGHGQREVTGASLGYLREPYDHHGFTQGVAHWIDRHNRYSSEEVELIARLRLEPLRPTDLFARGAVVRRRCLKRLAARLGFRPAARFFYTYVVRLGFLDGYPGLLFCLLRAAHEIHITVKIAERQRAQS